MCLLFLQFGCCCEFLKLSVFDSYAKNDIRKENQQVTMVMCVPFS